MLTAYLHLQNRDLRGLTMPRWKAVLTDRATIALVAGLALGLLAACLAGCDGTAQECGSHAGRQYVRTYAAQSGNCPPAASLNGGGVVYPEDATSTECHIETTGDRFVESTDWAEGGESASGTMTFLAGNTWCPAGGVFTFTQHRVGG